MEPTIFFFLLLVVIGFIASFLCSMVGLGGGVFFIPVLILLFAIEPNQAIGTSIFCMFLSTLAATIGYFRNKLVDWKLAVVYDIFDIPGIVLGAYLTTVIPSRILEIICGIAICFVAILVFMKKTAKQSGKSIRNEIPEHQLSHEINESIPVNVSTPENNSCTPISSKLDCTYTWKGKNFKWVLLSSFSGGLVTGLVGLGGGTVDTTTMVLMGVPITIAAGSSSLAMLLTNGVGFFSHLILGHISWLYALPIGFATLIGAFLGSSLAPKISTKVLRKILGGIAFFTGIRLLIP